MLPSLATGRTVRLRKSPLCRRCPIHALQLNDTSAEIRIGAPRWENGASRVDPFLVTSLPGCSRKHSRSGTWAPVWRPWRLMLERDLQARKGLRKIAGFPPDALNKAFWWVDRFKTAVWFRREGCDVPDCERPYYAKGMCRRHCAQSAIGGAMVVGRPVKERVTGRFRSLERGQDR